eukprot:GHVT01078716.1.p1 GENE.GHVT01078716.1~~GHVT01078716.1.p1  ORF type:complete len:365 (-),score=16.27 GHVT01078716.1:666-1760(-)
MLSVICELVYLHREVSVTVPHPLMLETSFPRPLLFSKMRVFKRKSSFATLVVACALSVIWPSIGIQQSIGLPRFGGNLPGTGVNLPVQPSSLNNSTAVAVEPTFAGTPEDDAVTSIIEQEIIEAAHEAMRGPEAGELKWLAKKIPPLIPPNGEGYIPEPQLPEHEYPKEIRCPTGWQAQGPHCLTILAAPPYTECSGDKTLKARGLRAKMVVTEPGVCAVTESTGAILKCKPGATLEKVATGDSEIGYEYQCASVDIIPYAALRGSQPCLPYAPNYDQFPTSVKDVDSASDNLTIVAMGVDNRSATSGQPPCRPACPLGYRPTIEGCRADQHTAPDLDCPDNFVLGGVAVNAYAFRGKEFAKCG